jgi:hypothetical protein
MTCLLLFFYFFFMQDCYTWYDFKHVFLAFQNVWASLFDSYSTMLFRILSILFLWKCLLFECMLFYNYTFSVLVKGKAMWLLCITSWNTCSSLCYLMWSKPKWDDCIKSGWACWDCLIQFSLTGNYILLCKELLWGKAWRYWLLMKNVKL